MCCPDGAVLPCASGHTTICAYCRQPEPDEEHVESHDHSTCVEKGLNARTFTRKDHLRQHLRLVHHVKLDPSMEAWKSTPEVIRSRCGFCNVTFSTWDERAAHLAKHFREGKTMGEWCGGWGLDPDVAACVTDAMPPFMIQGERQKPLPWSAEKGDTTMFNDLHKQLVPNLEGAATKGWEVMGAVLTDYVVQCQRNGEEVTEQGIQTYARRCLYESDDAWNQTRADNSQWMELFKARLGLIDRGDGVLDMHPEMIMQAKSNVENGCATFLGADLGPRCPPSNSANAIPYCNPSTSWSSLQPGLVSQEDLLMPQNTDPDVSFDGFDMAALTSGVASDGLLTPHQVDMSHGEAEPGLEALMDEMMWSMEGDFSGVLDQ